MGTNFYIRKKYDKPMHIGKRSAMARPEGAMVSPMSFTFSVSTLTIKRRDTIIDEYGNIYNYAQFFANIVEKCAVISFKIGEEFS